MNLLISLRLSTKNYNIVLNRLKSYDAGGK